MIEVDVIVPALNKSYDFMLDESTTVDNIIEEVTEIICQNEHITLDESGIFELCCSRTNTICARERSLGSYGIGNGDRLILV